MKAGIIGGTGKMGRLFSGLLSQAGYDVIVSGRTTPVTAEAIASDCDLVMVSVPIRETEAVIGRIAPLLSGDQLLCDLTSLKVFPVAAMLRSRAQVIGLHPMFGPTVGSINGQTIIVCPARADPEIAGALLGIFTAESAHCTISTPEEHDRMMAVVQGLTHYVTLCMADSIRRLGADITRTKEFTSPVYQLELSLAGRLLSQDPALYADILQMNPYVNEVLDACTSASAELGSVIRGGQPEVFAGFFARDSRHLGRYCREGQEMTDALIEFMVKR
jgi:prephenate dehydrogenase